MSRESEVGHNDETQTTLAADKYIHLRKGGNLQYRRRYPTDLVEAGVYKQADFKKSLGTKDRSIARRLALTLTLELDVEFEERRRKLQGSRGEQAALRPLSSLTDLEQRNFILRQFVLFEKREEDSGARDHDPRSDVLLEERLDAARHAPPPRRRRASKSAVKNCQGFIVNSPMLYATRGSHPNRALCHAGVKVSAARD